MKKGAVRKVTTPFGSSDVDLRDSALGDVAEHFAQHPCQNRNAIFVAQLRIGRTQQIGEFYFQVCLVCATHLFPVPASKHAAFMKKSTCVDIPRILAIAKHRRTMPEQVEFIRRPIVHQFPLKETRINGHCAAFRYYPNMYAQIYRIIPYIPGARPFITDNNRDIVVANDYYSARVPTAY